MKKKLPFILLLTIACITIGLVGCKDDNSPIDGEKKEISLSETKIELAIGETVKLSANDTEGTVVWSSNDTDIAVVDENGVVTPVTIGKTIIKAKDDVSFAMCQIIVVGARTEDILTVQPKKSALTLFEGDTYLLDVAVKYGAETVESAIMFESEGDAKVTVSENGLITAVSEGLTEIVVSVNYAGKTAQTTVAVSVSRKTPVISFGVSAVQAVCGEELPLTVYLTNGETTTEIDNEQVTYTLSDDTLANVENGVLVGIKKGNLDVRASYDANGETLQAQISLRLRERYTVKYYVDGVLWYETSVLDGESVDNTAPIPMHETYEFCAWESKKDETAIFSERVAYDFSSVVQNDLTLQAEWFSGEQKLLGLDKTIAGVAKNWQMNAAGTNVEYTKEKAYGEEEGSLKITSKYLEEYPASPAEVYLGALNLAKCKRVWFYIYNTQPNNYYFNNDWANRVLLSADGTWKRVEISPMKDGKVLVSINGVENVYEGFTDLSQDGISIHPAYLDTRNEICYTYVSAVYGIKELDSGVPFIKDENGNDYFATASEIYPDGLRYTAAEGYGESILYLPIIDFSEYTQVTFDWSIPNGWTFFGPDRGHRYYQGGSTLGGKVAIVKNNDGTLTVTTTQTVNSAATNVFTGTVDDAKILNGIVPLTMSLNCLVGTKAIHVGNFVAQ